MNKNVKKKASVSDSRKPFQPTIVRHFTPNMRKRSSSNNFPEVNNHGGFHSEVYKLVDNLLNSAANKTARNKCIKKKSLTGSCKSKIISPPASAFTKPNCNITKNRNSNQTTIISRVESKKISARPASCTRKSCNNLNNNKNCYQAPPYTTAYCYQPQPQKFCAGCRQHQVPQEEKIRTNLTNIGSNTNLRVSLNNNNSNNSSTKKHSIISNAQIMQLRNGLSSNNNPYTTCWQYQSLKPQQPENYVEKLKQEITTNKSKVAEDARKIINDLKSEIMGYRNNIKSIYSSSCTNVCATNKNGTVGPMSPIHKHTLNLFDKVKECKDTMKIEDLQPVSNKQTKNRADVREFNQENLEIQALIEEIRRSKVPAKSSAEPSPKRQSNVQAKSEPRLIDEDMNTRTSSGGQNVVTLWQSNKVSNCSSTTYTENSATAIEPNFEDKLEEANTLIEKVRNALNDIGKVVPSKKNVPVTGNEAVIECQKKFQKVLSEMEKLLQQSVELQEKPEKLVEEKYKIDTKKFSIKCICPPRSLKPDSKQNVELDYIIERIPTSRTNDVTPSTSASDTMQVLQEKLTAISEISTEVDESFEEGTKKPSGNLKLKTMERSCSPIRKDEDEKAEDKKSKISLQCKVAKEEKKRIEGGKKVDTAKYQSQKEKEVSKAVEEQKSQESKLAAQKEKQLSKTEKQKPRSKPESPKASKVDSSKAKQKTIKISSKLCICASKEGAKMGKPIEAVKPPPSPIRVEEEAQPKPEIVTTAEQQYPSYLEEEATFFNHLNEPEQDYNVQEETSSGKEKKLSIQLMPPINIRRGLVLQRTLNLSIKPTGSVTNAVVTPHTNIGYSEFVSESSEKFVPSEPECRCAASQTSAHVIPEPQPEDVETVFPVQTLVPSDLESRMSDLGEGSRRNTKSQLEMDEDKMLILRSFQVMDTNSASVSARLSQHSFLPHSNVISEKGSSTYSGSKVPQWNQEPGNHVNGRSPWDFGFYASKATQCDFSYFNDTQSTTASYKYPSTKGTYKPLVTNDLTEIPEKDVTPSITSSPISESRRIWEGFESDIEEENEEPVCEEPQPEICSESFDDSAEKKDEIIPQPVEAVVQAQTPENEALDTKMTDSQVQVSFSSSCESEEDEEEVGSPRRTISAGSYSPIATDDGSMNVQQIEQPQAEEVSLGFDTHRQSVTTESLTVSERKSEEIAAPQLPAKAKEVENTSSSDSSEFYKTEARVRSNTIQNFIQGLTGTSEHEFDEVSQPINKSLSRLGELDRHRSSHKTVNIRVEDPDSEIELHSEEPSADSGSSPLIQGGKPSSTQQLSEKAKAERLKLFQKFATEPAMPNNDDDKKQNDPTVMTVSTTTRNYERNDDKLLPLYKRVLGRFVESQHHGKKKKQKPMIKSQSDPMPIDDSISEGEISCKHSLSNGEIRLCKFADGVMNEVRQMRKHPEKLIRKELGDRSLTISRQRTQYNNWVTYYLQKNPRRHNDFSSGSSKSDSAKN